MSLLYLHPQLSQRDLGVSDSGGNCQFERLTDNLEFALKHPLLNALVDPLGKTTLTLLIDLLGDGLHLLREEIWCGCSRVGPCGRLLGCDEAFRLQIPLPVFSLLLSIHYYCTIIDLLFK